MKTYVVYGPPGTGKTTEMLNRVDDVKKRYKASDICYLSFTKAGAAEALKRLGISRSDKICTIHSLMYRLNGITSGSVVDNSKLRQFGNKTGFIFKGISNDTSEEMGIGDQYISVLSKSINKMSDLQLEYYDSDRPGNWSEFQFFCKTYHDWKLVNGYIDFNDMLLMYLKHPVPHETKVIFIDEAQDLSNLQWAVIFKMIEVQIPDEVHIAGDDDQCIYEWSGANVHGMVEFEDEFKSERCILNQSWRVPTLAHNLATSVVNTIGSRVDKLYLPKKSDGLVERYGLFNPLKVSHGEDTLILCRNFVTKKEIETELIRHRIPYRNEGGYGGMFTSRIADAIRVFNKLKGGSAISQQEIEKLMVVADDRTRKELHQMNFTGMLNRGYVRSFNIPASQIEFYLEADLNQEPTIKLSTIHASKGREADHVVLHTGLTSKTLFNIDKNPDSEARVFYVALTRTKHKLSIIEGDNGYPI